MWCVQNNAFPTGLEVPRASKQSVEWFASEYDGEDLWLKARYNFETGKEPFPPAHFSDFC